MGRFSLRLPKTLHNELEDLAKSEGISLNQYIIYSLTQKVTVAKQMKLLADVKSISPEEVSAQYEAFGALLSRLGREATDEEVEKYLSDRESVKPESDLDSEAVVRFNERIAQAKEVA